MTTTETRTKSDTATYYTVSPSPDQHVPATTGVSTELHYDVIYRFNAADSQFSTPALAAAAAWQQMRYRSTFLHVFDVTDETGHTVTVDLWD